MSINRNLAEFANDVQSNGSIQVDSLQGIAVTVIVSGGKFVIDGTSQQDMFIPKGVKYRFDVSDSSVSGHPLQFSETSDGTHGGGSAYTTGITTSGTAGTSGAYVEVQLQQDAPDQLYYYCSNHSGMGAAAETAPVAGYTDSDVNTHLNVSGASTNQILSWNGSDYAWVDDQSGSGGIASVAADTTPQLGGDLDVNGNSIVSASNGNIAITPDGTGKIVLDALSWPTTDGSANYVLKTDGSGNLSWAAALNHTEGSTEPTSPANGDTWWDTTNEVYKVYVNNKWTEVTISVPSMIFGGDRGVFGGGNSNVNNIDYLDLTTSGNASDFGDLTVARNYIKGAVSDKTYAVFAGGNSGSYYNTMDYITISTTGNAIDFGDMTAGGLYWAGNMSDGTTGFFAGGSTTGGSTNQIQKITIASTGNATDHGDLLSATSSIASCCDNTHAILGGDAAQTNVIQTFSMASASNATDFGDLTLGRGNAAAVSDLTYAVFAGGAGGGSLNNIMDYVTIQTTSNASDFGDLTSAKQHMGGASNGTNGVYAGANDDNGASNSIDKIVIATTGNATDFGDMTRSAYAFGSCSGNAS